MKLAYLVHKPRFDLIFGEFLQELGIKEIYFLIPNPVEALRFRTNMKRGEIFFLYNLPNVSVKSEDYELAQKSLLYKLWPDELKRKAPYRVASLRNFLEHFFERHKISALVLTEKNDLSALTAGLVAVKMGIPTLYLGQGFFRKKSLTASPFPLRVFYPEKWEARLNSYLYHRPPGIDGVPEINFYPEKIRYKEPFFLKSWYYKILYLNHFSFIQNHPDLFSGRKLWERFFYKLKKKQAKMPPNLLEPDPPQPFILFPLQGDEICKEVPTAFPSKSMEEMLKLVINIFVKSGLNRKFFLVVKEHPNRPEIISPSLISSLPSWVIFRRNYDMRKLLSNCHLVLTYNSLSGFEALLEGKKVICLAPIFYNLKNLVMNPKNELDLLDCLKNFEYFTPDWEKFQRLCDFIWKFTDVKIDNFSRSQPTIESLRLISGRLLNIAHKKFLPPEEWI